MALAPKIAPGPTIPPPRVRPPRRLNRNWAENWLTAQHGPLVDDEDPNPDTSTTPAPGSDGDRAEDPAPEVDRHAGRGGLDANGVWTPPTQEYLAGLASGGIAPLWAGQPGSPEYIAWQNMRRARGDSGNAPPPVPPVPENPTPDPSGQQGQNRHSNRSNRNRNRGVNRQAMQAGSQALYNDNTIDHDFKGRLLQAAQSGNAQAFNEMLFNSGIPHETKMRLQQLFGYGNGSGGTAQAQAPTPAPQDQGQNQTGPYNGHGSPYYGAFD